MNAKSITRTLLAVASALTAVIAAVSNFESVAPMISPALAKAIAIALPALLALKEVVVVAGDYLDDGKRNNSFGPLLLLTFGTVASAYLIFGFTSCSAIRVEPITDIATGISYESSTDKNPGGQIVITQDTWDALRDFIDQKWPGALPEAAKDADEIEVAD